MRHIDRKAQMMDAGTALFRMEGGFGTALGQVKAEMAEFGQVRSVSDAPVDQRHAREHVCDRDLPASTAHCDLFLDYSTPWRYRYISCLLEESGESGAYAATFKEGNRSTPLRAAAHILGSLLFLVLPLLSKAGGWLWLPGIVLSLCCLYDWLRPSRRAQQVVQTLIQTLSA